MATIGRGLAVAVAAVVLAACQDGEGNPASSRSSPARAEATADAGPCPVDAVGTVDAGSVLVPGPSNGLPLATATGVGLVIVGVVLDRECGVAAGANVNLWHTDALGAYGPAADECCYYQGAVRTDSNGRFRVETIRPGRYAEPNAPPAHIHLEIVHPSGALMTEIVFAGDPGAPSTAIEGTVPVELRAMGGADQSWYGEVTLVLGA